MPSGAKKRKAARKKKESQAHLNGSSTNSPQDETTKFLGTDHEVKSQDEKDSDVSDVNSPPPQDEEEQERENPFSKGTQLVHERDHSAIQPFLAESNSSWEEINGFRKHGLMKNAESVDVSNDRDGEHSTVRLVNRCDMCKKNLQEESTNSVIGAVANDDMVRTSDSSSNEVTVTDIPVEKLVSMVSESSTLSADEPSVVLSQPSSQVTEHSSTTKPVINTENETPAAHTDLTFKRVDDKAYPLTDVNVMLSSSGVKHKPERYDREELPSSHLPIAALHNSEGYIKDSGIPECSENQRLIAFAPRVMERTSWLSCCGLFEVLSGSSL